MCESSREQQGVVDNLVAGLCRHQQRLAGLLQLLDSGAGLDGGHKLRTMRQRTKWLMACTLPEGNLAGEG
jgi:hypothetical protein